MSEERTGTSAGGRLSAFKRKPLSATGERLVNMEALSPGESLPLLVRPSVGGVDLLEWAASHREVLERNLHMHGGILFRDFAVNSVEEFEQFIRVICGELLEYRERSSPRSFVSGNIYTSTDHPADQSIFLHNENSYQQRWPMKLFFYCRQPAERGGETPIADCRKVYRRLDPALRQTFIEKGWMYMRNFGHGFGLDWQTVFQTDDPRKVEEHCRLADIACAWKDEGRLQTRAVRPAVARHPRTGETVWFNHLTFFHVTTLDPVTRDAFQAEFKDEDLPTNTYYGDGTPIESHVLDQLRAAYEAEKVVFTWRKHDILMLDNMLAAHGRNPYVGERRVLVGMGEPTGWAELKQ
jgi:alpha-ketoglutarate-dependent taurine dioxygenase